MEGAVDFDLPIVSNETLSVRRHDLDLVTLVSELGRRDYSAIRVDVEIRRLLRHCELLLVIRFVEPRRDFFTFEVRFLAKRRMISPFARVKVIHSPAGDVPQTQIPTRMFRVVLSEWIHVIVSMVLRFGDTAESRGYPRSTHKFENIADYAPRRRYPVCSQVVGPKHFRRMDESFHTWVAVFEIL